jgi:esterase/lipase superfamily enzyme
MEMLSFGHAGTPVLVFPTSCGRFFEFEDRGMVATVQSKIQEGHLHLFCVDSVDSESWYNRAVPPRWRIARHIQYEQYLMQEVLPLMREGNRSPNLGAIGCSFGGYHAVNIALRHPDIFTAFLSMGGAFNPRSFLSGYYDDDCYFNLPMDYLSNIHDCWYLDRYRRNTYILATGVHDQCWNENERFARILHDKRIPCRLDVWGDGTGHDWPWWQKMIQAYH